MPPPRETIWEMLRGLASDGERLDENLGSRGLRVDGEASEGNREEM